LPTGKKASESIARTAEQPEQAINVDLCFVPVKHVAEEKLPAVSGSSGHLVIERCLTEEEQPKWPGQVFAESELSFEAAMQAYANATQDRQVHNHNPQEPVSAMTTHYREELESRAVRHQVMVDRKKEDGAWFVSKAQERKAKLVYRKLSRKDRVLSLESRQKEQTEWDLLRKQQLIRKQTRKQENMAWHENNLALLSAKTGIQETTRTWIAILVMTDNCTRQCAALPIFETGPKVTAEAVECALRAVLPLELKFLISDQGKHFKTKILSQLAQDKNFTQVFAYRHRPQSNGIAERFVLTFKQWMRSHSWISVEDLKTWVALFLLDYNDRPHQGLAIPGLSPNEFAKRMWLM
jgi:transposase InsO family protein